MSSLNLEEYAKAGKKKKTETCYVDVQFHCVIDEIACL
jgi:hypothetical protein